MNAYRLLLFSLCLMSAIKSHAVTNDATHSDTRIAYLTRIAQPIADIPGITLQNQRMMEEPGAWGIYTPEVMRGIEETGNIPRIEDITTNDYYFVPGYTYGFSINELVKGYVDHGTFSSVDEARAAFLYGTTTTASVWHYDSALADKLVPPPDEVMFTTSNGIMFRKDTTCVYLNIFGGEDHSSTLIDLANRILSEIAVARENE